MDAPNPDSGAVIAVMQNVAATEIMPRFRMLADHHIREKRPGDKVTVADEASEAALRAKLPPLLPGSLVLGEEGYEDDPKSLDVLSGDAPVWIVDPIDGTHNFAHGHAPFCVIVALYWRGRTRAGWIYDPNTAETVWCRMGEGVYRTANGKPAERLSTPLAPPLVEQRGSIGEKFGQRMLKAADEAGLPSPHKFSRARCVSREYMDMALGRLHFGRFANVLKPWDHAAGTLIVREIGGRAENTETGQPYEPAPVLEKQPLLCVPDAGYFDTLADLTSRAG